MYIPAEYLICCLLMVGIFLTIMAIALIQAANNRQRQKETNRLSKAFDHSLKKYLELGADLKTCRTRTNIDTQTLTALTTTLKEVSVTLETVQRLIAAVGRIMVMHVDGLEIDQFELRQRLDRLMHDTENKTLDEFWQQL